MKIKIEIDSQIDDMEVIIKAKQLNNEVLDIQKRLQQDNMQRLNVYKNESDYFIPLQDVLFIEANSNRVYVHTATEMFETREKLYQLENWLPVQFCRVSKSVIINMREIYALDRSFSGTSSIRFLHSEKQAHVSRHYYKMLKDKLIEMRYLYEK